MTTEALYQELNYVNHSREKRLYYANLVIENPSLVSKLLDILFMVDDKISPRAGWVLEFMCKENIEAIILYLDPFLEHINKIHIDSAVRPVAKICEYLAKAYYSKQQIKIKKAVTLKHQEKIIEACFNWLINDKKVATKAYAMQTLFLFGRDHKWIHQELKLILERDYNIQSTAYKARARLIINKLKTS